MQLFWIFTYLQHYMQKFNKKMQYRDFYCGYMMALRKRDKNCMGRDPENNE